MASESNEVVVFLKATGNHLLLASRPHNLFSRFSIWSFSIPICISETLKQHPTPEIPAMHATVAQCRSPAQTENPKLNPEFPFSIFALPRLYQLGEKPWL
jgi:hypothetical protein